MSTSNPAEVMRVPGRLVVTPTNLATSFPYGGTELGVMVDHALVPNQQVYLIRAEEYGGIPVEGVHGGESWVLVAVLKSWDPTALDLLFPGLAAGTTTQKPRVYGNDSIGSKLADRVVKLLFAPHDEDRHPMVLFYAALPCVEESARIRLVAAENLAIPVVFHAILDQSSRLMEWGMRQDLTL